mgnify:CR=1 FL=1
MKNTLYATINNLIFDQVLFSSIIFIFGFLPLALFSHTIAPKAVKNIILLLFSLFFYAWGELSMSVIMLASITINYVFGVLIELNDYKKLMLTLGLVLNVALLVYYKYINFLMDNLNSVLDTFSIDSIENKEVHLPIGISFFTFQGISYIMDVYRKKAKAEYNPINIGLYISLFPQLIAGPIVRYNTVMGQIKSRVINWSSQIQGAQRFIIGLSKKVIIANTMAVVADSIMNSPFETLDWSAAWLGIIAYSLQIYFDFSGYSDMAIGLGKMLGFTFEENFNYPYISQSIKEFWKRWHISLSTWFRDYLYIPLGGNRKGPERMYLNLIIVFLLTGFWHGASWSFILWGLIHGAFIVLEKLGWDKILSSLPKILQSVYCLLIVVVAWVFFRIDNFSEAFQYLGLMFLPIHKLDAVGALVFLNSYEILIGIVAVVLSINFWSILSRLETFASRNIRGSIYLFVKDSFVWIILVLSFLYCASEIAAGTYNPFIYFRF